ncbi:dihydrolipoyl dehydrogenase [Caryophanon latum]|uniref:Dihydrolipoyl dehydrogenase n=1 Tax=Caryophanon latum TaxID=33977 RepID=A0A1C0YUS0_9BACL|nr:dihydrolipoyl dehydrogenase [Caryophanon latum]OCS90892.1 dihydrolipoyl dehydrogenase [Caryophanon latum]
MAQHVDVVVLGGGPGGYSAAIRAAQLGLSVALVEAQHIGGTCLHRGCIPTKSYLETATRLRIANDNEQFGIETSKATVRFEQVVARKDAIVKQLQNGIEQLLKKGKVQHFEGYGRILGPSIFSPMSGTISVERSDGSENDMIIPQHIIVATGSKPKEMKALPFDGEHILSSDHLVTMAELPQSIIIVGGGVIGVEWASIFVDLGVDVTIVEHAPQLLPQADRDVAKAVMEQLTRRGVMIYTNAALTEAQVDDRVTATIQLNDDRLTLTAQKLVVAIGRSPNTDDIGLQNTEIERDDAGFIAVDAHYKTNESHMYAIGDCIATPQLAHVAIREGMLAAEHIAGEKTYALEAAHIPSCIYSYPEVAYIGMTEQQARAKYADDVAVAKIPLSAVGKAHIHGETTGFMKIIEQPSTSNVLGIHIVGAHATELIAHGSLAMVMDASVDELSLAVMAHPTISEGLGEAALRLRQRAIHF